MRKGIVVPSIAAAVVVLGAAGGVSAAVVHGNHGVHSVRAGSAAPGSGTGVWSAPASPTPSWTAAAHAAATPAVKAPATTAAQRALPAITYVVKSGDNLTVIAAWFHQHGYGALYDANRAVIGSNPNLIFPGQRITIANGSLTTATK